MSKKIAHIVSTFPPYGGGMGNVTHYMVDGLAARGHDVCVITPDYDKKTPKNKKQDIVALAPQIKRLPTKVTYGNAAILKNVDEELDTFDVIHLHFPFYGTSNMVRRWKKRHPKKTLVITYHMDSISLGWKGVIFNLYAKYFTPKVLAAADCITVSSLDYVLHSDIQKFYDKHKHTFVELPFGVDTTRFFPDKKREELVDLLQLDPKKPIALFVGGMDKAHYFKGVEIFIDALSLLKQTGDSIQAVCIGKGDLLNTYKKKVQDLELKSNVHFLGFVPDNELPTYYQAADVTVLPSIHQGEAFGMVLLESMACGTPVIASDLPGVRTIANKGGKTVKPGMVMDLAGALRSIKQDPNYWKKKQKKLAGIIQEKYLWKDVIDQLEDIYETKQDN